MEKVMYKLYHKSDFKFVMRRFALRWDEAEQMPWPDVDWRLRLWTPNFNKSYEVSCISGVMRNCARTDDGGILIVMDNHGLATGELRYEFHFDLPDGAMPSGVADIYKPGSTGIYLTAEATGECTGLVDVQVLANMYKGDPFRYSDFTPEQLEDLRRPAIDAATRVDETISDLNGRQRILEAAERARSEAETLRAGNEADRVKNEEARRSAEQQREAAEQRREGAEGARRSAESDRTFAEAARRSDETKRIAAEQQRVSDEAKRRAAESTREGAEEQRVGNEEARVDEEVKRAANETAREKAEEARAKAFSDALIKATDAIAAAKEALRLASEATALATEAAQRCNLAAAEAERISNELASNKYLLLETE